MLSITTLRLGIGRIRIRGLATTSRRCSIASTNCCLRLATRRCLRRRATSSFDSIRSTLTVNGFRYAKARVRGGETVLSLAKGTRVNLNALVSDIDKAVDILFELDPESPRNRRERNEQLEALAATQRLPVHLIEKGFGTRRSADGYVLLPTSVAPGLKRGELVRLMEPDGFDLAWKILRVAGSD
jgi:hypothetical protein